MFEINKPKKISDGDYRFTYRDPITKKKHRARFKTKALADAKRKELLANFSKGKLPINHSRIIEVLMKQHFDECPNTGVRSVACRFEEFMENFGKRDITKADVLALEAHFERIKNEQEKVSS